MIGCLLIPCGEPAWGQWERAEKLGGGDTAARGQLANSLSDSLCPADLNDDQVVDIDDLFAVLGCWGQSGVPADINQDGTVDIDDVFEVLAQWGPCPEPEGMVLIPGGEFEMGDHYDVGYPNEKPVHTVFISPFYMSVYETTNDEYCAYLNSAYAQGLIQVIDGIVFKAGDSEPYCDTTSHSSYSRIVFSDGLFTVTPGKEDHPMLRVSWYGTVGYANWRCSQEGLQPSYNLDTWQCNWDAGGYRLPTEAEWEYAARGDEHDPYYKYPWGNGIDGSNANYEDSGDPYENGPFPWTTPVGYYNGGQTPPGADMANGYGLYDMAGNVWEWCNDWYADNYYSYSPYDNPKGPDSGTYRVIRGGAWREDAHPLRCACRYAGFVESLLYDQGFRLVLD